MKTKIPDISRLLALQLGHKRVLDAVDELILHVTQSHPENDAT
jgi:hypothetical protein